MTDTIKRFKSMKQRLRTLGFGSDWGYRLDGRKILNVPGPAVRFIWSPTHKILCLDGPDETVRNITTTLNDDQTNHALFLNIQKTPPPQEKLTTTVSLLKWLIRLMDLSAAVPYPEQLVSYVQEVAQLILTIPPGTNGIPGVDFWNIESGLGPRLFSFAESGEFAPCSELLVRFVGLIHHALCRDEWVEAEYAVEIAVECAGLGDLLVSAGRPDDRHWTSTEEFETRFGLSVRI